jgi:hypothetical protein
MIFSRRAPLATVATEYNPAKGAQMGQSIARAEARVSVSGTSIEDLVE